MGPHFDVLAKQLQLCFSWTITTLLNPPSARCCLFAEVVPNHGRLAGNELATILAILEATQRPDGNLIQFFPRLAESRGRVGL